MSEQITSQAGNFADGTASPAVSNPDDFNNGEFFKTPDCADNDPSNELFRRLLLEAISGTIGGRQQPVAAPEVGAQEKAAMTDGLESMPPLEVYVPEPVVTASTQSAYGLKLLGASASLPSSLLVEASQPPAKQILSTRPVKQAIKIPAQHTPRGTASQGSKPYPTIAASQMMHNSHPQLPQRHVPQMGRLPLEPSSMPHVVKPIHWLFQFQCHPNDLGNMARASRFIRHNPQLDRPSTPFTTLVEDVVQVLKLAQQRGYFELEHRAWSSLELAGDNFRIPEAKDSSPFSCVIRYARSPLVNSGPWCDDPVQVKMILKNKLSATGHTLLRELDPDYVRRVARAPIFPVGLDQMIIYAQQPSQRQVDWSVLHVGTLSERLGLTGVGMQARPQG
ncbi:hypothetical protein P171DRAFT_439534 [Karstenula rhodostoma CBS 690.94]|uniref:Uncharacterized protein n=1 Tax=Karstenula rhodostoma CBS 690.94 TaxID=1392251 RepID=A0A9P4PV40_9PLEO|nr:hypothetical protein P171DRAFT_439534 [Karstenula rhodostoma CBS 690.94]